MNATSRPLGLLIIMLGSFIPQGTGAQQPGTREPVQHRTVISANPFLMLGEWVNVEFERKIAPTASVGALGSSVSFGGDGENGRLSSLNAFYRFYPQAAALTGFYLELRGGVYQGKGDDDSGHAFGLGIQIGYAWLLGPNRNFSITMGAGATRLFGGDLPGDVSPTVPHLRLINIGVAF